MNEIPIIGGLLVAANVIVSYYGFSNNAFFDKYKFHVDRILLGKEYRRLVTSGFLHGSWGHLAINMYVLWVFGNVIEFSLGMLAFSLIYFVALIGGSLLSLYVHRNHGDYSAIGASGATSGIVFAYIALFPDSWLSLLFIPISFPAWLFGLAYVLFSIYGIKAKKGNIGHAAHLGGSLAGMLLALALRPEAFAANMPAILGVGGIMLGFVLLILVRPQALILEKVFPQKTSNEHTYSIDHKYNAEKVNKQKEIDDILDKIGEKGMDGLSAEEKKKLDEYSKTKR